MRRHTARTPRHVWLSAVAALLVASTSVACSNDGAKSRDDAGVDSGGTTNNGTGAIGTACTSASDCSSPVTAACLTSLKPLATVAGVTSDIADLGLDFPNGYCSSQLNCASDAQCATGGSCFRPFAAVSASTLRDLENTFATPLTSGSLDFLTTYGVCLANCTTANDCQSGYSCEKPLASFISLVTGAVNNQNYCVPNAACSVCDANAACDASSGTAVCVCKPGYVGSGTTCTPATDGGMGSGTLLVGSHCTADNQCVSSKGTPDCLSELHPLASIPSIHPDFAALGLDFVNGYCSTVLNCASNLECGTNGYCLQPFRNVTPETLRTLEGSFDPTLAQGELDFLTEYAVCMRRCSSSFDCEGDQSCEYPLASLISIVTGAENTQRLCVPNNDCAGCTDAHAYCATNPSTGASTCTCEPGWNDLPTPGTLCTKLSVNPCTATTCMNSGTCNDLGSGNFSCTCAGGYTGTYCQNPPTGNACSPNPCQHAGTCTVAGAGFTCACAAGWSGSQCETAVVDPCAANPCANGGTCNASGSTYTCACASGYEGATCQTNTNECATVPCMNGGVCIDGINSYTCMCPATHTGAQCQTAVVGCSSNPCLNGATCVDGAPGSYTCTCASGWSGTTCNTPVDACAASPCANGGACTSTGPGTFTCACPAAWTGSTCQTDVNECLVNNGGCSTSPMVACINATGSSSCAPCPTGYTGNGVTCTDVDECALMTAGCAPTASCANTVGSYTCTCGTGYTGNGVTCTDVDECATNNGGCSTSPMVTCTNSAGSSSCGACPAGYTGNGMTCTDVNECTAGMPCDPGGVLAGETCANSAGSYSCTCPGGYAFNGTTCVVANACLANPNACDSHATCVPNGASFTCSPCSGGYTGAGTPGSCVDINECNTNNGGCSTSPMVTCTNTAGSFSCGACPAGYTGNGTTCMNINECALGTDNCATSATCTDTNGSFTCACNGGYSGNGVTCADINECSTNNGGCSTSPMVACTNSVGSFSCGACPTGYTGNGMTCTDVNECATNNGGCSTSPMVTCTNSTGSFSCGACPTGYTGNGMTCTIVNCGALTAPANGTVTTAGGTTYNQSASYACNPTYTLSGNATRTCQANGTWSGSLPTCVAAADPCSPNPCLNGGTCTAAGASYTCACADGWSGATCATQFYCDVVYRMVGDLAVDMTPLNAGNGSDSDLTNASLPPFLTQIGGVARTTPFTVATWGKAMSRLRFPGRASTNQPVAGSVGIVEWYIPVEFTISPILGGATTQNVDQSAGILGGSVGTCASKVTASNTFPCFTANPTSARPCSLVNSGTLATTTLSWATCGVTPTGGTAWYPWNAQDSGAPDGGCLNDMAVWGTVNPSNSQANNDNKGDQNAIVDQQLQNIVFSSTSYSTATWTMGYYQVPNGGQSRTRVRITAATPLFIECNAAGSLTCNETCTAAGCQ